VWLARDYARIFTTFEIGEAFMQSKTAGEKEGPLTSVIETQTSKVPSGVYLGAAVGSMAASAILKLNGRDDWSHFIAQWAPAFLILGVYNKMVKQQGNDGHVRHSRAAAAD
jgi:hypothetical protein